MNRYTDIPSQAMETIVRLSFVNFWDIQDIIYHTEDRFFFKKIKKKFSFYDNSYSFIQ